MRFLRRALRMPVVVSHVLVGVVVVVAAAAWDRWRGHALHHGVARSMQVFWSRSVLRLLGARLHCQGASPAPPPALVVSNHLSWMDILVIAGQWPVSFVSKSEVRKWPGIGLAATALGTLYIDRGARNASAQANAVMAERLSEGHYVVLFPEGTTSIGEGLLPFRPRLFQAALDTDATVQPVTLRYRDANGERSAAAPFVRDEPLMRHVWRLAGEPRTDCYVDVCRAIPVAGQLRRELAAASRSAMASALGLPEGDRGRNSSGQHEAAAEAEA